MATIGNRKRQATLIRFPYTDLENAAKMVAVLHNQLGDSGTRAQLSTACGHDTAESGTFRNRLGSAVLFGLIKKDKELVKLTTIGIELIDEVTAVRAKIEAFLNVPLYRRVFEEYEGRMLPSGAGLEHQFKNLGVPERQVAKARQVFMKSADFAGFFGFGRDKLVLPPGTSGGRKTDPQVESKSSETSASQPLSQEIASERQIHPAIAGMLQELPCPDQGWSEEELELWSTAFLGVLRIVFKVRPLARRDGEHSRLEASGR